MWGILQKHYKIQNIWCVTPPYRSSASVYRSRALIQSLSNAARAARVEGPPVPGGSTHSTAGSTHSLKSKLELLGPTDGEELMSEGQRQLQLLLRKQLDTSSTFETYVHTNARLLWLSWEEIILILVKGFVFALVMLPQATLQKTGLQTILQLMTLTVHNILCVQYGAIYSLLPKLKIPCYW